MHLVERAPPPRRRSECSVICVRAASGGGGRHVNGPVKNRKTKKQNRPHKVWLKPALTRPGQERRRSGDEEDGRDTKFIFFLHDSACVCVCVCMIVRLQSCISLITASHPGIHSDTASFLRELKHPCNSTLCTLRTHTHAHIIEVRTHARARKWQRATRTHTGPVVVVMCCSLNDLPPPSPPQPPRRHPPTSPRSSASSSSSKLFENQLSQQTSCKEWVPGTYS